MPHAPTMNNANVIAKTKKLFRSTNFLSSATVEARLVVDAAQLPAKREKPRNHSQGGQIKAAPIFIVPSQVGH